MRIFISYSSLDRDAASYIARELECRGADVFIDYEGLKGGDDFIGRLGSEIESSDWVVLLFSPRSEASRWVRAEISWAFSKEKSIIPVMLEPAPMTRFFFLIDRDYVDFGHWLIDQNMNPAIHKLARSLNLPDDCIQASTQVLQAPIIPSTVEVFEPTIQEGDLPIFNRSNLTEMFQQAVAIAEDDPEQAIFLYQSILETDPNFMRGKAQEFVQREEARLKPIRLRNMQAQAEAAMHKGEWQRGAQIADDMLALDSNNLEAKHIKETSLHNEGCEPLYEQASIAHERNNVMARNRLLLDILEACPKYGDPQGLLENEPISVNMIKFFRHLVSFNGHKGEVNTACFAPKGSLLASGSDDKTIRLWNINNQMQIAILNGHNGWVRSVMISPNGKLLASCSEDSSIRIWNVRNQETISVLEGHEEGVFTLAFSPNGEILASGSGDGTIRLWDVSRNEPVRVLQGHADAVYSIAFADDGTLLASGGYRGEVYLWNMQNTEKLRISNADGEATFAVAFSPDSRLLAFGRENTIYFWDVLRRREIAQLEGHSSTVLALDFSPDGSLLASGSLDNTLRIWDTKKQIELMRLDWHNGSTRSVKFSEDGMILACGSGDSSISLWGLSPSHISN
jgi:WD40 repeat protein